MMENGSKETKTANETEPESTRSYLGDFFKITAIAVGLALFTKIFVAQAYKIPSESMVSTLLIGDHLLVDKFSYNFKEPTRGDIVVFHYPKDPNSIFVKRLIGLPGETISERDKTVYIDGRALDEPYAIWDPSPVFSSRRDFGPIKIERGRYFMMGDNRDYSSDSRAWGTVPFDLIEGKAVIIHWSWRGDGWGVRLDRVGKLLR